MFLFSRPTDQIRRFDAAKSIGVFHLFDKRRDESRLGGPKGNDRLGRIQLFFDFFVPAFTNVSLRIEKDQPALRPQAFLDTIGSVESVRE